MKSLLVMAQTQPDKHWSVAQIGNLLYRRLVIGRTSVLKRRAGMGREPCRLPTCDTADYPSALRIIALLLLCGFYAAAAEPSEKSTAVPTHAAKELFDHTVKTFHLPSAEAKGSQKDKLLAEAASGYQQLLKKHPDQTYWCAQAWRSLGNVRATQGRLADALKIYSQIEKKYPTESWEILQAWKSAADLLWEAKRFAEAKAYYRKIVQRFDTAEAAPIIKATVKGAKARLAEKP